MPAREDLRLSESCRKCPYRRDAFFCQFDGSTLKEFDAITSVAGYPPEAVLFMEGEPARGVFVVCQGLIKLTMNSRAGKSLILRIAEPGEILGLESVIGAAPYQVTAQTLRPSQVTFVRSAEFLKFIAKHPAVYHRIAKAVSSAYDNACYHLRLLALASNQQKVARILLDWSRNPGENAKGGSRITVPFTHSEIGELIGSTRESVTRALSDFKRARLITVRGTAVTINDRKLMEELALS
jgi:CRP/FNR family transcriptional regulator, cyclic AMP receptor protein